MEYQGFRSIREYEAESARLSHRTRRVPFHNGKNKFFVLISTPPGHPDGGSVESWTLFSADETRRIMDGVINSRPENYLFKLAKSGYFPDDCKEASAPSAPEKPAPAPAPAAPKKPAPVPAFVLMENGGEYAQFSFLL